MNDYKIAVNKFERMKNAVKAKCHLIINATVRK